MRHLCHWSLRYPHSLNVLKVQLKKVICESFPFELLVLKVNLILARLLILQKMVVLYRKLHLSDLVNCGINRVALDILLNLDFPRSIQTEFLLLSNIIPRVKRVIHPWKNRNKST